MPAIPKTLNRTHIEQAIARIRAAGVPLNAKSTKFDLIDPISGDRLPPKLILAIAVELATGVVLSRQDFTGGEATNAPLRAAGFEIMPKPGVGPELVSFEDLAPGMSLSNEQLSTTLRVGNAGGMRWSGQRGCLVIIADHTKGLYDDRWEDDVLLYTGMGRFGDQELSEQNLRVATQASTGTPIHLFEVFQRNQYIYSGIVKLAGSVREETQPDDAGNPRRVYLFPLALLSSDAATLPRTAVIEQLSRSRRRVLQSRSDAELLALALQSGRVKPGRRQAVVTQYQRSDAVSELVRRLADGKCDMCRSPAPFATVDGPYLECHHVQRLADGGADTVANAVALCPNCHRKMHLARAPSDLVKLELRIGSRAVPSPIAVAGSAASTEPSNGSAAFV